MMMPAHYEDSMQELEAMLKNPNCTPEKAVDIKMKAMKDTVSVLKQFGYDSGADIFINIMNKMYG